MASLAMSAARVVDLGRAALDLLLPSRCLGCGIEVGTPSSTCPACWTSLSFITPPCCRICGRPLPHAAADAPLCGVCSVEPPAYDRARAALRYDEGSKRLILASARRPLRGAAQLRPLARGRGAELAADADWLVPVPLHRWRLLSRGYNQSAAGRGGGAEDGASLAARRAAAIRATRSQQGLNATDARRTSTPRPSPSGPATATGSPGRRCCWWTTC